MYQVMIVDDEKMIVNSLALGFDWKSYGFEVVGTCTSSTEALRIIEFMQPDVVLTDIRMPVLTGLDLMKKIREKLPQIHFVVLSGHADFAYAREAMALGASAYCLKPLEEDELCEVLQRIRRELDAWQMVMQSAFDMLLHQSSEANSRKFLQTLMPRLSGSSGGKLGVAVCCGRADPLLVGNVSFITVQASAQCCIHVITSNLPYLDTLAFRTMLLNGATGKQIKSFAYREIENPEVFFEKELDDLFNNAYSFFVNPFQVALGKAPEPAQHRESLFVQQLSAAANKNKLVELRNLLSALDEGALRELDAGDAVKICNICNAAIARAEGAPVPVRLRHIFELTERYASFHAMLADLLQRLGTLCGAVNMDMIHNQTLRLVLEDIGRNYSRPISFQQLCEQYNINASYLSQLFKKELGITFTAYLTQLRLGRAKELLRTTNMRISEISDMLGYDYYFNFTKLFKREVGMTPKEYRTQYAKTED